MISINGYIDPVRVDSGFMIPTFVQPPSNAQFVQKRDSIFSDIKLRTIDVENASIFVPLDQPINIDNQSQDNANALTEEYFAFKHQKKCVVGTVEEISSFLKSIMPELEKLPVLYFDVVRFLNDKEKYAAAFAVAYTHIGTSFSKKSANNWQDTQIFLPAIYKALQQKLFENVSDIKNIEVSSNNHLVQIKIETAHDFNLTSNQKLFLEETISTYDPELNIVVKITMENQSWERIASQQISEDKVMPEENTIERKLKEMARNLEEYNPEKRKKEADHLRRNITSLVDEAGATLIKTFGDQVKVKVSHINFSPLLDGTTKYQRNVTVTVPVVPGKSVRLDFIVEPLDVLSSSVTLIGARTGHLDLGGRAERGKFTISTEEELEKAKVLITEKTQNILNEDFIRTFEKEIEKFKP